MSNALARVIVVVAPLRSSSSSSSSHVPRRMSCVTRRRARRDVSNVRSCDRRTLHDWRESDFRSAALPRSKTQTRTVSLLYVLEARFIVIHVASSRLIRARVSCASERIFVFPLWIVHLFLTDKPIIIWPSWDFSPMLVDFDTEMHVENDPYFSF